MKALWTEDEAQFHGVYENFDPVWSYPKPVQRPYPPILLGGETDHTLKRVAAYCDGWLPRAFGGFDPVKGLERLHQIAGEKGRDPSQLQVTVFGAPADAAELARYRAAGIQRGLLAIPDLSRDEILRLLDKHAPLVKEIHAA
jgi:alkanesulfonate monooxygenase SsuD/methylene tetrahydromethanopterin reductase-like flavin-dependent oxidoreductase (luciferase family)